MEAPISRWAKVGDWGWFLTFALLSSWWCLEAGRTIGATFDETIYLNEGLQHWRTGSYRGLLRLGTMPLAIDVQTLPPYLWERARGAAWDLQRDFFEVLTWMRAANLAFWWLLLLYARLIGRSLGGAWAGRLAVAVLALEPNFLAHATLATTDMSITAMLLVFAHHYGRNREAKWRWRVLWPGTIFGLAFLAKASALAFVPIIMLAIEVARWIHHNYQLPHPNAKEVDPPADGRDGWKGRVNRALAHFRPWVGDGVQIGLLGLTVTFVYCGSDWKPQASFVQWANSLPDGSLKPVMVWTADHLRIFSNAGEAIARQIRHNVQGHSVFILGETHPRSLWYYFPVALSIKLALPVLLLPLLVALIRPRSLANWACLAAALLLVYSLNCKVQIGIRFMLPLVALAVVGVAAASIQAFEQAKTRFGRGLLITGWTISLGWLAYASVAAWPHGLCYANELWGGSARAYQRLSDSNYDWGQGLPELADWQQRHADQPLDIWYFGTDPRLAEMPARRVAYQEGPLEPTQFAEQARGRVLAVSATLLYGSYLPKHTALIEYLRAQKPAARTTTFFIYDFRTASFAHQPHDVSRGSVVGD